MQFLFVAEYGFMVTWQDLIKKLKEKKSGHIIKWQNVQSEVLNDSLKKEDNDGVIFIGINGLGDAIFYVSDRKKPFVILSEESEEKIKRDLSIDDIEGALELFHYIKMLSLKNENLENIIKMIEEIFS